MARRAVPREMFTPNIGSTSDLRFNVPPPAGHQRTDPRSSTSTALLFARALHEWGDPASHTDQLTTTASGQERRTSNLRACTALSGENT